MNTKFKRPTFTAQWYTRQAAADSLGISLSTITRWVQAAS